MKNQNLPNFFLWGESILKIEYHGKKKDIEKAKTTLEKIEFLEQMSEPDARLKIQDMIDEHDLKAAVMVNGNSVWSKNRILGNLEQIIKHGTLYDKDKPKYYPIGSMFRIPCGGKPVLSKYFYEFLNQCCGSIAHYNIHGWISQYPTVEDLKQFFLKNEHGKRVLDDIPSWKTDAIRIVEAIELRLFPFKAYVRQYMKRSNQR